MQREVVPTFLSHGLAHERTQHPPPRWPPRRGEQVAFVSPRGVVRALAPGRVEVTATGFGQEASIALPVVEQAGADSVSGPPQAIARLLSTYARALESRDLDLVKALYPTIPAAIERRTAEALRAMDSLRVRLGITSLTVNGDSARAAVTGAWSYRGGRLDVSNVYSFERRAGGWVIVRID